MQIERKYQLWAATSTDRDQPVLNCINIIRLTETTGVAVATNGFCLASVPVQLDPEDIAGLISVEALRAAYKTKQACATIRLDATTTRALALEDFDRPRPDPSLQFPDYQRMVPVCPEQTTPEPPTFNPFFLLDLTKALGMTARVDFGLTLVQSARNDPKDLPRPMIVLPFGSRITVGQKPDPAQPFGIQMPMFTQRQDWIIRPAAPEQESA